MTMNDFISSDALFWFYSTLAQIFGAMLALTGVFVVYRLQDQRGKIKDAYLLARSTLRRWGIGDSDIAKMADANLKDHLDHEANVKAEADAKRELQEAKLLIERRQGGEIWIKEQLIFPLFLMSFMLIVSVALLPLHRFISNGVSQILIFSVSLLISVLAFVNITKFIFAMVFGEQNKKYRETIEWKKLVGSWRHLFGAILAAFGTFIAFSPNIDWMNELYDQIPYFQSLKDGMTRLTDFKNSPQQEGDEKEVSKGNPGFEEILGVIRSVKPEKTKNLNIVQITNRRQLPYREGSGESYDLFNVIHVHDPQANPPYPIVGSEIELRVWVQSHRDRLIGFWGTSLIILGIFWQYLFQGLVFFKEQVVPVLMVRAGQKRPS
jgi:hypothetical protein